MLTELKNRGVDDVFFLICDGLKGLPDAVGAVWPLAIVQTCVVHLLRNTFRHASKKDWDAIKRDVKPIYTAAAARDVFCQVVIGQCGVSFPSEKAVGFSPVRNWPVIARVLLFHCIRA